MMLTEWTCLLAGVVLGALAVWHINDLARLRAWLAERRRGIAALEQQAKREGSTNNANVRDCDRIGSDRPADQRLTGDWLDPYTPNKEPFKGPYVTDKPPNGFPR